MLRVAILADTHGLLRPRVLELAAGCDLILHAGDVGEAGVLDRKLPLTMALLTVDSGRLVPEIVAVA